eukprot:comp12794_c0_seq1/m.7935 comp12794_c0_seq1/g.7935  ORF comp12794_c0_seq1/g.7935 comp12794_c0_seq1/m.7935 type:complete len:586 (-) comp12794_c0_seq1:136-1893(-)
MFKKPFHIKANTALRGSDQRKLRAELEKQYPLLTSEQAQLLIPNKEAITLGRLQVHGGQVVQVYYVKGQPILISHNDQLYPTVYGQWLAPGMLPILYTHDFVYEKMHGGADLMLPGLILPGGVKSLAKLSVGGACAVALHGSGAAVAIGISLVNNAAIEAQGLVGRGVQVLHVYKDHLWEQGTKQQLPQVDIPNQDPTLATSSDADTPASSTTGDNPTESSEGTSEGQPNGEGGNNPTGEDGPSTSNTPAENEGGEQSKEEEKQEIDPDTLLRLCFLTAIKSSVKDNMLPLLASSFYAQHLLPARPPGTTLDIKKTSYKKLSKYLLEMQKEGLVKIKEQSKGVEVITDINRAHPDIKGFVVPKYDTGDDEDKDDDKNQSFAVREVYRPTNQLKPIFGEDIPKDTYLSFAEVRAHVNSYITKNNLIVPNNKRMVKMDPHLTAILLSKNEDFEEMPREDVVNRTVNKCQTFHIVSPIGQDPVLRKGPAPKLHVVCEQRMGKKVVTIVRGLSLFCVDVDEFAKDMQTAAAASTTVQPCTLGGQTVGPEVLIQGHAVKHVETELETKYHIPKKFMEVTDKSGRAKSKIK